MGNASLIDQWGGVEFDLMKVTPAKLGYAELLADIARIYENAQQVLGMRESWNEKDVSSSLTIGWVIYVDRSW